MHGRGAESHDIQELGGFLSKLALPPFVVELQAAEVTPPAE
jgi:hypothetical protein